MEKTEWSHRTDKSRTLKKHVPIRAAITCMVCFVSGVFDVIPGEWLSPSTSTGTRHAHSKPYVSLN